MRKMVPSEHKFIRLKEQKIKIDGTDQWTHDVEGDYWYFILPVTRQSDDEIVIGDIYVSDIDADISDFKNLCTLLSNGLYLDASMDEGNIILCCKINPATVFTQVNNGFTVRLCHFYQDTL